MNEIVVEILDNIEIGYRVSLRSAVGNEVVVSEGTVYKISDNFITLDIDGVKRTLVRLDDIKSVEILGVQEEIQYDIDEIVVENVESVHELGTDESDYAISEADEVKLSFEEKKNYQITRKTTTLQNKELLSFSLNDTVNDIREVGKNLENEALKNVVLDILNFLIVFSWNTKVKYDELKNKLSDQWGNCVSDDDYFIFYYTLGILSIAAEDYKAAREPLVRAKKYSLAAYAANTGNYGIDGQVLLICALLNGEYDYVDRYIADILISQNDVAVFNYLLKKSQDNEKICEDIFSCIYSIFVASKNTLLKDITDDYSAYEASLLLLEMFPNGTLEKSNYLNVWELFCSYEYPSDRDTYMDIVYGTISAFDVDKLFGFIDSQTFFHISQVVDMTPEGSLLRRLLGMGLGEQLEVTYYYANNYHPKGGVVAAGIQLTEKGAREAERRFENLENNISVNKGRLVSFDKTYQKGVINVEGRKVKFRFEKIVDPWLKKYLRDESASTEQNVIFSIEKGMAVNICWYKPNPQLRKTYSPMITKVEKRKWQNYVTEQAKQGRTWTLSYNDPFEGQKYKSLPPASNLTSDANAYLNWGGSLIFQLLTKRKKNSPKTKNYKIPDSKEFSKKNNTTVKTLNKNSKAGFISDARNALTKNNLEEAEKYFLLAENKGELQEAELCDFVTLYTRWDGHTEKAIHLLKQYADKFSVEKLLNISISVYQKRKDYNMLCVLYRQGFRLYDNIDKKALFLSQLAYATSKLNDVKALSEIDKEWHLFCEKNMSSLNYGMYKQTSQNIDKFKAVLLYYTRELDEARKIALSILDINPNDRICLSILSGELEPMETAVFEMSEAEKLIIEMLQSAKSINSQVIQNDQVSKKKEPKNHTTVQTASVEVESTVDLSSYIEDGFEFGLLTVCSNNYGTIMKEFRRDGIIPEYKLLFETPKVKFSTGKKPNTAKSILIVKYKCSNTDKIIFNEVAQDTVENGSMITIIKEISKKELQYAAIAETNVSIKELVTKTLQINAVIPKLGEKKLDMVDMPVNGENIIIENGEFQAMYVYSNINGDISYIDDRGQKFDPSVFYGSKVWRFGCITDFDINAGIGIMNNSWQFSLDAAVSILNIVKAHFSSTQPTGLYCLFTCKNNIIVEILRIKESFGCIQWESGLVKAANRQESVLEILYKGQKVIHRSTTETNPYINRIFRKGEILNTNVWVRCVSMLWRDSKESVRYCREEILDIHIKEQTPTITYNEKTDSFEGVENQTERFVITGSEKVLRSRIGTKDTVVFLASRDGYNLECRLKSDNNVIEDISDIVEANVEISDNFANAPLVKLYLQDANLSQTSLRTLEVDETGMPKTLELAEHSFKKLFENKVAFPENWLNQLVAIKIAMAYPEEFESKLDEAGTSVPKVLLGVLRMKMLSVARDSNVCYGELAYGLSTIIQYDTACNNDTYNIVWLLLQDLGTTEELKLYESHQRRQDAVSLRELCRRVIPEKNIQNLIAHLLQLNATVVEKVCKNFERNTYNVQVIKKYLIEISNQVKEYSMLSEMIVAVKSAQKRVYREYSRNIAEVCLRKTDICDHVAQYTDTLLHRWLKTTTLDDYDRFLRLKQSCESAENYKKQGGFEQQESILIHSWNELDILEREILEHPCKDSTEMLIYNPYLSGKKSVISRIKEEITEKLCRLYSKDSIPTMSCKLNEEFLPYSHFINGETHFYIRVSNGDRKHMLQPAENVILKLESLTPGITVTPEIKLDRRLNAGEEVPISVNISADDTESLMLNDVVTIIWSIEFLYTSSFVEGHPRQSKHTVVSQTDPMILQLGLEQQEVKNCRADNPYKEAAKGNPLKENSSIYRHRSEEYTILNCIIQDVDNECNKFQSGATVIVHGQKKIGKTSLIKQIKAYIERNDVLRDKAIIIQFDSILSNVGHVKALPNFLQMFCDAILRRFKSELRNHEDIWMMLKENNLEVPDLLDDSSTAYARFSRFFDQFEELDGHQHTIILFMDEFTTLCTSLLVEIEQAQKNANYTQVNYLQHIPDFIKDFSGKGFIQVVIGHEAMIRSLDELGMLNQTKEFATDVELMSLSPDEADALIKEPMMDTFYYDPYRTSLGTRAMDYIRDLTGCHPTFLVRICNIIFDYYIDKNLFPVEKTQLTQIEVENAVSKYISKLQLTDFDILLVEDGDGVEKPENRKTYQYLKCLAEVSLASYDHRTADSREVRDKMKLILGDAEEERIRNILHARHVIKYTEGGRMRIETGLFLEYIRQRQGGQV